MNEASFIFMSTWSTWSAVINLTWALGALGVQLLRFFIADARTRVVALPFPHTRMEEQLYEVCVPAGVAPGQAFQVQIGGALMAVQCPPDVRPGETIQATTAGGRVAPCTVAQQLTSPA